MDTFGERLKQHRLAAHLTQEELAKKCGMKKQSISRYEKSDREPNISIAKAIADALGVPLEALVGGSSLSHLAEKFNLQMFSEQEQKKETAQDERHALVNELFDQLPPEKQARAVDLLKWLSQSP